MVELIFIFFCFNLVIRISCSYLVGGIVALGKFDALHVGHRELAIQAAKVGVPFLLSFVGMAEVLGWEPRYGFFYLSSCSISLCILPLPLLVSFEMEWQKEVIVTLGEFS